MGFSISVLLWDLWIDFGVFGDIKGEEHSFGISCYGFCIFAFIMFAFVAQNYMTT